MNKDNSNNSRIISNKLGNRLENYRGKIRYDFNDYKYKYNDLVNFHRELLFQPNFQYCISFLKNAGENLRAVRLVMDTVDLSPEEAQEYVNNLVKQKNSYKPLLYAN